MHSTVTIVKNTVYLEVGKKGDLQSSLHKKTKKIFQLYVVIDAN